MASVGAFSKLDLSIRVVPMKIAKITCDRCGASHIVNSSKIPVRGAKVKCKKCAHTFLIKTAVPVNGAVTVGAAGYFCPRCGATWNPNDNECRKCGLAIDGL